MKKRILALLIIAFSLSACQPTPEEELEIGKTGVPRPIPRRPLSRLPRRPRRPMNGRKTG